MSRHLQIEIEKLKKNILALAAMVEENVQLAVQSVDTRSLELAKKVMDADEDIDALDIELEEECLKILALHQPVAVDLRFITAILKITSTLERIGDLAVNLAKQAKHLAGQKKVKMPLNIPEMSIKTQIMLKKSLNALVSMDTKLALEVCSLDDEIDIFNKETYNFVCKRANEHPEQIGSLLYFISVSRYLERIADHATNIAVDVVYMVDGEIIRHNN